MPEKDNFNLPIVEKRIHRGNDFDDLIQQAMDASSHHDDDENLDSTENDMGDKKDVKDDVEIESLNNDDSSDNSSDSDSSLESNDLSFSSMVEDDSDKYADEDSYVSNVPLVDEFESVMEMKNPAPMGQSVSSYVDHLNRREGGKKSTMIKAGVFAILIAVVVGVTLTVLSMTDSKDMSINGNDLVLQPSGESQVETPGEVNDNLFHSVEVSINGDLSLSGLVIPVGGLEHVKGIFEMVIAETVSIFLDPNQTVLNVSVAKISTKVKEDQAVSNVNYKVVVEEKCRGCSQKEGMEETLIENVVSNIIEAIKVGNFTDNLHKRARIQGSNTLLSAIVIDGDVEGFAATLTQLTQPNYEFPTQQPSSERIQEIMMTLSPSPPPTPRPRPIPTLKTPYPVTEAVIELFRTPPPSLAPTPLPTKSPVTLVPETRSPFPLPLVEFAPTDPPSDLPTKRPTQLPTKRPSPRPTPRTLRPTTRPTPKPLTRRPTAKPVYQTSSDSFFCARVSYTANWNILLEFGDCSKRCSSMSHSECEPGYQCRQSDDCLEMIGPP